MCFLGAGNGGHDQDSWISYLSGAGLPRALGDCGIMNKYHLQAKCRQGVID